MQFNPAPVTNKKKASISLGIRLLRYSQLFYLIHITQVYHAHQILASDCDIKFSISLFCILFSQRTLSAYVKFLSTLHDSGCVEGKVSDLNNAYSQVKVLQEFNDSSYKALEKRIAALEGQQSTGAAPDVDTPSDQSVHYEAWTSMIYGCFRHPHLSSPLKAKGLTDNKISQDTSFVLQMGMIRTLIAQAYLGWTNWREPKPNLRQCCNGFCRSIPVSALTTCPCCICMAMAQMGKRTTCSFMWWLRIVCYSSHL